MDTNKPFKLIKKIKLSGKIECLSGLKIGGSTSALSIGGVDSIIIRNPKDNKPYIPGSSLKGKLRYLTEIAHGTLSITGKDNATIKYGPSDDPESIAVKLFGSSSDKKDTLKVPSRVIVRDAHIINQESDFPNASIPFAEIKTEVIIDRVTSKANPRTLERVPQGAEFAFEIILNIFNFTIKKESSKETLHIFNSEKEIRDEENLLLKELLKSLKLLEEDYLGGNGSRGYGNIKIHLDELRALNLPDTTYATYSNDHHDINNLIKVLK